jgi:hypothetical protein
MKWTLDDDTALVDSYDARMAAGSLGPAAFELPSGRTVTPAQARRRRSRLKGARGAMSPPVKPAQSSFPIWSKEDDDTLVKVYDARRAAGEVWSDDFTLPSGRTVTLAQARSRRSRLKAAFTKYGRVVESDTESETTSPPTTRLRRFTPLKQRAAAVDVWYVPTPTEQRAIINDPSAPLVAKKAARKAVKRHQWARLYKVKTAEIQHRAAQIHGEMRDRESYALPGPLCRQRSVLREIVCEQVALQAADNRSNAPDVMQLRELVLSLTSHRTSDLTPAHQRDAAFAFISAVDNFIFAERKRRVGSPVPAHRAEPHVHDPVVVRSLLDAVGVYVDADLTASSALAYTKAVSHFVEAISPPGVFFGPATEQATIAAGADASIYAVRNASLIREYGFIPVAPSDHRPAVSAFATAVGVFAAAFASAPLREKRGNKKRRRGVAPEQKLQWASLIEQHMVHWILKCCADCAWAGTVYDQHESEAALLWRLAVVRKTQADIADSLFPRLTTLVKGRDLCLDDSESEEASNDGYEAGEDSDNESELNRDGTNGESDDGNELCAVVRAIQTESIFHRLTTLVDTEQGSERQEELDLCLDDSESEEASNDGYEAGEDSDDDNELNRAQWDGW